MFIKRVVSYFCLIVVMSSIAHGVDIKQLSKNRPQKDHQDFFGYNPRHDIVLERNPWGFHEFWWIGPDEGGPYTLQVAQDSEFKKLIYFQTVNRFYDFTRHLPDDAEVYWRVIYKDRQTPAYKVKLIPTKKYHVEILPAKVTDFDFQKKVPGSIWLRWKEKSGVGPYDVEVSPDPHFSNLVFRKRVRKQEYKIEKFAEAGKFYWRVKLGRFVSPVGQFRINQAMVNAEIEFKPHIELELPKNGEVLDVKESKKLFRWTSLGYETLYRLEIAETGDFGKVIFSKELKENSIEVETLSQQGSYFWRVTSPRYESPVYSFVVAPANNIFQKGISLFRQILFVKNNKKYFASLDYQLSSLKASDLDNSTRGQLTANQYLVLSFGMEKVLYPTWLFDWSIDYSMIDRHPPSGLMIRSPVNGLIGGQVGVKNKVLQDFKAGLSVRYNEFEILQTITGSFFEMNKSSALSVGGSGEYNLIKGSRLRSNVGAEFYSALPFLSDLGSAFVSKYYLDFDFRLFDATTTSLGLYYQTIGLVKEDSSQSSEASGVQLRFDF